ncbi:Biopolymer transport protein ExbD [Brevundimonas subvibrioides]|jgi:biopolymer transport protein ExbD|uniref:Biopolymer transport protein ExbD/TolR n=1 Tax=Brevundimonas subvibrioides (strain ATCC 15264 / DSM 4735 / LMG 14903 / NBRC 16000 / CB 81) TaxID=633149 RepID=D9QH59_BRESC|nr:biopolymer transporter ExbD [Brevundimonas subvibrioides]ADL01025.1 Biopolymer transport protein ExbD/TolR [Brevundimonas subvibrioides ATCC 15264]
MAAKLGGSGGGKYQVEQTADINVTPFVDIMLVLLIIFMVASSVATVSVVVKLPVALAPPAENPPKPVFISIRTDGRVFIGDGETTFDTLGAELTSQIGRRDPTKERIFIRADQQTRYGDFMQTMNALQDAGFYSVALVGEDKAPQ